MKTLHLLRHAKSDWNDAPLADRERSLNARGRRDAPAMGQALAGLLLAPQPILLSPARRARQTLEGLCEGWPALASLPHRTVERLYTFDSEDLLGWLQQQPDSEQTLFIIGHNPGLTDLANKLVPDLSLANLPTAGYLQLQLPIDRWQALSGCAGRLTQQLFPKQLPRD
ncbi:SixA phosphatase family protein [Kineobactrum salinum]|uniref:Phosphoglycerate mutase n=1 Tax=Kineobactrum salinum TaxID=2708301 RepID=A0A6C0U2I0_9GAMM|nr:histidine phosphatase family protein [Kineobactrum salinum]QIB66023.1 phosphoglycerate mutase [Kineobactrum salinum]